MASASAPLVSLLRAAPVDALTALGESLESLIGLSVRVEPLDTKSEQMAECFGGAQLYVVPLADPAGVRIPAFLALDRPVAFRVAGAFSMMNAAQIAASLEADEVPPILEESIGEVAKIVVASISARVREHELGAAEFRAVEGVPVCTDTPVWPELLTSYGESCEWRLAAARVFGDDEALGHVLVAATVQAESTDPTGPQDALETPEPVLGLSDTGPESVERACSSDAETDETGECPSVIVVAPPGHAEAERLCDQIVALGHDAATTSEFPALAATALFVVVHSAADLDQLMRRESTSDELLVVCSDAMTRDVVLAARRLGARDVLVLPAAPERVKALLARDASHAC